MLYRFFDCFSTNIVLIIENASFLIIRKGTVFIYEHYVGLIYRPVKKQNRQIDCMVLRKFIFVSIASKFHHGHRLQSLLKKQQQNIEVKCFINILNTDYRILCANL